MKLNEYYEQEGIIVTEGYTQQVPGQVRDLKYLLSITGPKVLEIGFNAGHSSELFLEAGKTVLSFDLGGHVYTSFGKQILDLRFPKKHTLVVGNSANTVDSFASLVGDQKFDFIFIDGGHDFTTVMKDLKSCKAFAKPDTIVAMDDTIFTESLTVDWNIGPTKAWEDAKEYEIIQEINHNDYSEGRGMAWGHYC
jgi:predicted O-methyltransferase YrrM